jgi:hypothetical protein
MYCLPRSIRSTKFRFISTYLIAAITDGIVANIAARSKKRLCKNPNLCTFDSRGKIMARVMAMLVNNMAKNTKVKVIAISTRDKLLLWKFYY